jgi:hypothetical protein
MTTTHEEDATQQQRHADHPSGIQQQQQQQYGVATNPSGLCYRQAPSRAEDNKRARSQASSPLLGLGERATSPHQTSQKPLAQSKAELSQNFPQGVLRTPTSSRGLGTPNSCGSGATSPQGPALEYTPRRIAAIQGKFPSFREAEPSQNFSPAPGDQIMSFNGFSTLGTPVESVQSYRTADLLPAGSPLRDPTGNVALQPHNDEIHKLRTEISQLTDHRNTLASQLRTINTSSICPTKRRRRPRCRACWLRPTAVPQ